MWKGIIFSIMAGLFISLQNIFNARLSERIGFWNTNSFVQGTGFLTAFIILLLFSKINLSNIMEVNKVYLLSGVIGAFVLFFIMKGISYIGASYAVTILIVSEILFAFTINVFGFLGEDVIKVSLIKVTGLILMISGVILFQFGK